MHKNNRTVLQVLKNFRATYPDGEIATQAWITRTQHDTYQAVTMGAKGVIEVFECPLGWTIWACREFLAGSADVSRGRWVV